MNTNQGQFIGVVDGWKPARREQAGSGSMWKSDREMDRIGIGAWRKTKFDGVMSHDEEKCPNRR
ncbi:MAG: hypothetical protein ACFCD0_09900 [Gemmataceae bacterium]